MVRSNFRHPAPRKDWAQLNSRRKAKGTTAGLVAQSPTAADHSGCHDVIDSRRRARAHGAPAGGSPRSPDLVAELDRAAAGADVVDVFVALRLALSI